MIGHINEPIRMSAVMQQRKKQAVTLIQGYDE